MSHASCPHEDAVATAARTDAWPEVLAAHAAECAICCEVAQMARWMQELAASDGSNSPPVSFDAVVGPLPDPAAVWRRAQIAENSDTAHVRNALEWVQIALMAATPVGLAGWVAWNWYSIEAAAAQFLANALPMNALPQFAAVTYALASLAPAALTLAVLSLAYPLLAGD